MMEAPVPMQFRVLYKLPGERKAVTTNLIADDLRDLMTTLTLDGITTRSVDFLYVHYSSPATQETMECVAIDNTQKKKESGSNKCNVVPISSVKHLAKATAHKPTHKKRKEDKPHLRPDDIKDMGIVTQGLYTAMRGG